MIDTTTWRSIKDGGADRFEGGLFIWVRGTGAWDIGQHPFSVKKGTRRLILARGRKPTVGRAKTAANAEAKRLIRAAEFIINDRKVRASK